MDLKPSTAFGRSRYKSAYSHLFEEILGGNPTAISLAASIFASFGMEKLYERMNGRHLLENLAVSGRTGRSVNVKMRFSLNLVLKLLERLSIDLFALLGYFPAGLRAKDLDVLFPKVITASGRALTREMTGVRGEWKRSMTPLMKASLVTRKTEKLNGKSYELYQIVPILSSFAVEKGKSMKEEYHRICLEFSVARLESILRKNSISRDAKQNEKQMNRLWYHESNVWDGIFRALEIKKNLRNLECGVNELPPLETSESLSEIQIP